MEQTDSLKDVLQFYADAGVDIALDETPHDRLAAPPQLSRTGSSVADAQPSAVRSTASAPAPGFSETKPHEVNVQEARDRAASANSLDELMALLVSYEGCGLKTAIEKQKSCWWVKRRDAMRICRENRLSAVPDSFSTGC